MQDKFDSLLNGNTSKQDVENFVNNKLTQNEKEKLNEVLNDKNKLNELLSSPLAQELMKKFRK